MKAVSLEGFDCKQCGLCCKLRGAYQNYATDEDFRRWELEGRTDILEFVTVNDLGFDMHGDPRRLYNVWMKPGTEEYLDGCPFLKKIPEQEKYICSIHDTKPWHCRSFPSEREYAERIGCIGFSEVE
ncbi:MAG: YkgJ family cysteine cluster protein [Desulforhabdus sp.]|jgi:Fe-S-cluster containining protein|nr:YkgJ family cysteine cluster protein [Desulforhabdus sp.]